MRGVRAYELTEAMSAILGGSLRSFRQRTAPRELLTTLDLTRQVRPPHRSSARTEAYSVCVWCSFPCLVVVASRNQVSLLRDKYRRRGVSRRTRFPKGHVLFWFLVLGSSSRNVTDRGGELFRRAAALAYCHVQGASSHVSRFAFLDKMTSATTAVMSQGRKRRRNRQCSLAVADGNRSPPTPATFPRVATAPANLGLSPKSNVAATTTRAGSRAKTRRPSCRALIDTSEVDAQISTLSLIRAYGYGAVPGTPLQRGNTTSSVGRPKCRTAGHGARDLATASRKEKRSVTCGGTTLAPGKADREEQQSKTRGRSGSSRNNREPWTGPLDIGVCICLLLLCTRYDFLGNLPHWLLLLLHLHKINIHSVCGTILLFSSMFFKYHAGRPGGLGIPSSTYWQ